MRPEQLQQLHDWCKVLGILKHELVEELPHYGNDALFLQNDEITTGQLNNRTEIKIHLLTGQFLYFHDERGHAIDLLQPQGDLRERLAQILEKYRLVMPAIQVEC